MLEEIRAVSRDVRALGHPPRQAAARDDDLPGGRPGGHPAADAAGALVRRRGPVRDVVPPGRSLVLPRAGLAVRAGGAHDVPRRTGLHARTRCFWSARSPRLSVRVGTYAFFPQESWFRPTSAPARSCADRARRAYLRHRAACAPVALQLTLGLEVSPWPRSRFFLEWLPTEYLTPYPDLFAASMPYVPGLDDAAALRGPRLRAGSASAGGGCCEETPSRARRGARVRGLHVAHLRSRHRRAPGHHPDLRGDPVSARAPAGSVFPTPTRTGTPTSTSHEDRLVFMPQQGRQPPRLRPRAS